MSTKPKIFVTWPFVEVCLELYYSWPHVQPISRFPMYPVFIVSIPVVRGSAGVHIAFNSDLFTSLIYLVYSRTVSQPPSGLLWQRHCCGVLLWRLLTHD